MAESLFSHLYFLRHGDYYIRDIKLYFADGAEWPKGKSNDKHALFSEKILYY